MQKKIGAALVVGAGISGIRSALDLAEMGYGVTLIDKAPRIGGTLHFSVSHTTRLPRAGERNGVEYYFVDEAAFRAIEMNGGFLEWAVVHGNRYGTPRSAVAEAPTTNTPPWRRS